MTWGWGGGSGCTTSATKSFPSDLWPPCLSPVINHPILSSPPPAPSPRSGWQRLIEQPAECLIWKAVVMWGEAPRQTLSSTSLVCGRGRELRAWFLSYTSGYNVAHHQVFLEFCFFQSSRLFSEHNWFFKKNLSNIYRFKLLFLDCWLARSNFWLGALNECVSECGVCPMMDWIRVRDVCLVDARPSCVWCTHVQGVLGRHPRRLRLVDTLPGCIPASHPVTAERDTTTLPWLWTEISSGELQ